MKGQSDWLDDIRTHDAEAEARSLRVKRGRFALLGLTLVAALAFAAGWNPSAETVHTFTAASDYNSDKESGCTNSGEGCHGSESAYTDFNAYHPDTECGTCHEYEGVGCIPCHSPAEHECPTCHDGTMEGTPDRVKITDSYPRGHYRETTHTAMGTDMKQVVRAAESGTAQAACSACHSRDLRDAHAEVPSVAGSEYGVSLGCGECHNDVRSYGMAEVLEDWTNDACEDCHKTDSSAPMHAADVAAAVEATSTLGCGNTGSGCHESNDLHAEHANAPDDCSGSAEESEPGCHDLEIESHKPTAKTCGSESPETCHATYSNELGTHKNDAGIHSPETNDPASDTSFFDTACGGCHRMAPDGTSLLDEHALPTSSRSEVPSDSCHNCHDAEEAAEAIANDWQYRNTDEACEACHGNGDLPAPHDERITGSHMASGSTGCANSGSGCHPTSEVSSVGKPTTTGGIHRDCLRCHDWTESDGNRAYNPGSPSCGSGRRCHATEGEYDPATAVHDGVSGRSDGQDSRHTASPTQRGAALVDVMSGNDVPCSTCHAMQLATEHDRVSASTASGSGTLCARCHNASATTASVVKSDWPEKTGSDACAACHASDSIDGLHAGRLTKHRAVQLDKDGEAVQQYCVKSGCHATTDVRRIHRDAGCDIYGCHSDTGDILGKHKMACGGDDSGESCHVGYSSRHPGVSHSADLNGVVNGIAYTLGENVGCFGCHYTSLTKEHSEMLSGGSIDGGGTGSCRICHYDPDDSVNNGSFADLQAVTTAIGEHDKRCVACHASGSDADGGAAVASPHKVISTESTLPAGSVWSDPLDDWKAAFEAETGGGHNSVSAEAVGASTHKDFPLTSFAIEGTGTVRWALPPNEGRFKWLREDLFGSAIETDAGIRNLTVACQDCHIMDEAGGPHGAAIPIFIDPEYSQTEWANPSRAIPQFMATGTDRVICYKCHLVYVGAIEGTETPGGADVHSHHTDHRSNPVGEACTDCHVRIPHAWKRPRLLVRAVETTDGVEPDTFPYVREGHNGLLGVQLMQIEDPMLPGAESCVTGGCYSRHKNTSHPLPEEREWDAFWP